MQHPAWDVEAMRTPTRPRTRSMDDRILRHLRPATAGDRRTASGASASARAGPQSPAATPQTPDAGPGLRRRVCAALPMLSLAGTLPSSGPAAAAAPEGPQLQHGWVLLDVDR